MVLSPGQPVVGKALSEKGRISDFPPEDRDQLTATLGHYSKLQSANSEDTVTWSVFGSRPFAPWLPLLMARVFQEPTVPTDWSARFWERQAHPDTGLVKHGPESEITLTSPGWCIEVESKWLSDLDGAQGSAKNVSQIQMRAHTAKRNAGENGRWGVLVVAPSPRRYPPAARATSVFRAYFDINGTSYLCRPGTEQMRARIITWEEVASFLSTQPGYEAVATYLQWRLMLIDDSIERRSRKPIGAD